jgi:hypothetical protein
MVGGCVGLQLPGDDYLAVAVGQGTAPLVPGLAGVMVRQQFGGLVEIGSGHLDLDVWLAAVEAGAGGLAGGGT